MKTFPHYSGKSLALAVATVALTACGGAVTVTGHKNISGSYDVSELYVVAGGDNELRTVIVGNPFDMPQPAFEQAVLANLRGRNIGPPLNLSTDPKQEDPRMRRVLLIFNIEGYPGAADLCRGTIEPTTSNPTDGRVAVAGVYCASNLPLTQARVRSGQISGTDTDQFRTLMSQLAIALFPTISRRDRQSRD